MASPPWGWVCWQQLLLEEESNCECYLCLFLPHSPRKHGWSHQALPRAAGPRGSPPQGQHCQQGQELPCGAADVTAWARASPPGQGCAVTHASAVWLCPWELPTPDEVARGKSPRADFLLAHLPCHSESHVMDSASSVSPLLNGICSPLPLVPLLVMYVSRVWDQCVLVHSVGSMELPSSPLHQAGIMVSLVFICQPTPMHVSKSHLVPHCIPVCKPLPLCTESPWSNGPSQSQCSSKTRNHAQAKTAVEKQDWLMRHGLRIGKLGFPLLLCPGPTV